MMDKECEVPSEDKVDCGYYGIKQNECAAHGCCWRPSKHPNDPWCFSNKKGKIYTFNHFIRALVFVFYW